MSLDVYLRGPVETGGCRCSKCGHEHVSVTGAKLYHSNITHNLGAMAKAAGIYEALWRPEEIGIATAAQLASRLEDGLKKLRADPAEFSMFNAANGWGLYEHFVPFVEQYLVACKQYPTATVEASR